ncbi:MAG: hypothetical protein ACJA07_003928, partial [Rhodococcus sp. (in: high G+C Gram-positive bacteria)]
MSADRPSCDFRYGRPDSQYDWMLAGTARACLLYVRVSGGHAVLVAMTKSRYQVFTDEQWARIEPLL